MLRLLGAALLIVLAFSLVGAAFEFLAWALVVGALVFAGVVVWSLLGRRDRRRPHRRARDTG